MKKFMLLLFLILVSCCVLFSCNVDKQNGTEKEEEKEEQEQEVGENPDVYYTITFCQTGQSDILYSVKEGEDFFDFPTPVEVDGYDISWEITEILNVDKNITVNAIITPKTYVITLKHNDGKGTESTVNVIYKTDYILPTPVRENADFKWWKDENSGEIINSGIYNFTKDIILIAEYEIWTEIL